MLRLRAASAGLAGLLGVAVLLSGCSRDDPAPAPATGAAPSATTSAVPTPSAAPTSASPTGAPTSSAPTSSAPAPSATATESGVEPSRPVETASPRRADQSARTGGADVSLVSLRATNLTATAPGDRSGPGVLVRVKITNAGSKTLDTSFVQVGVADAAGNPGTLLDGSPTSRVRQSLAPGRSAEGTYALLLDDARSSDLTVLVFVSSGDPVVQFRGRAG